MALALVALACGGDPEPAAPAAPPERLVTAASVSEPAQRLDTTVPAEPTALLVFTRTLGFRHDVLGGPGSPDGVAPQALRELAASDGVTIDITEDPGVFTDANLARYDAVVFLHTTGDVLGAAGEGALQRYVEAGGGFAGVHSAADTEYDWPWYGGLIGAYFLSHPAVGPATIHVDDPDHPATAHLPVTWERIDEWYGFRSNPRGAVRVLATLDESSYAPGDSAMGADHPIAWCHHVGAGQAWYTGLGHTAESFTEPLLLTHLWNGILSVAGVLPADCTV